MTDRKGFVVLAASLLMAVMSTLVLSLVSLTIKRSTLRSHHIYERQAFYASEAAVDQMLMAFGRGERAWGLGSAYLSPLIPFTENPATYMYTHLSMYPFSDSLRGYTSYYLSMRGGFVLIDAIGWFRDSYSRILTEIGSETTDDLCAALIITGSNTVTIQGAKVIGPVFSNAHTIPSNAFQKMKNRQHAEITLNSSFFNEMMNQIYKSSQVNSGYSVNGTGQHYYNDDNLSELSKNNSIIRHGSPVVLSSENGTIIDGPLIIESMSSIQVSGNIVLNRVTLIAQEDLSCLDDIILNDCTLLSSKRIFIADRAKVNGSFFSRGCFEIYDQATVMSNSLIYNGTDESYGRKTGISIHGMVSINGTVILNIREGIPNISIGQNCVINGLVYASGSIDLEGVVNGTVITNMFLPDTVIKASTDRDTDSLQYIFRNGTINYGALPEDFEMPYGIGSRGNIKVISWKTEK